MANISEISKTDLILLSLLDIKICTASQIRICFYESASGVHAALKRLVSDGLLVERTNGINRESIYYLTQRGYLYLEEAYAVHLPHLFRNSTPRSIASVGNKKIHGYIQHTLAVGDIYYMFLKYVGFNGYTWSKREDRVYKREDHEEVSLPSSGIKISDALVKVKSKTYLFEIDRALESRTVLAKKLYDYADYLFFELSRPEWPDIIFSVLRLDESQRNQYPGNIQIVQLGEDIKNISSQIKTLSRTSLTTNIHVSEKDMKLFSQKSEEELIRYREALELIRNDTVTKKRNLKLIVPEQVKGVGNLIKDINTYLHSKGVDGESITRYNQLVKERNEKRKELTEIKDEIIASKRLVKEQARKKQLISIIEEQNNKPPREGREISVSFKDVILKGLNFYYVGTNDTPSLIEKFSLFTEKTPCEKTAALFTMLMSYEMERRNLPDSTIKEHRNFTIKTSIGDVSSPLAIDTVARKDGTTIRSISMIDDITCGNLGGLIRVQRMCNNMVSTCAAGIDELKGVIIIDSHQQKTEIINQINQQHNNPSQFIFINLNKLAQVEMEKVTMKNIENVIIEICEVCY